MDKKEALLEELAKEDLQVLSLAYIYAKNLHMYGEDVTKASCSAIQNVAMLDKAYQKGYYDAMNGIAERREDVQSLPSVQPQPKRGQCKIGNMV